MTREESKAETPSPVIYGLGKLGVELMAPALGAYFIFYYVDVLGLTGRERRSGS